MPAGLAGLLDFVGCWTGQGQGGMEVLPAGFIGFMDFTGCLAVSAGEGTG